MVAKRVKRGRKWSEAISRRAKGVKGKRHLRSNGQYPRV